MAKTKHMTEALQSEEMNVLDAMVIVKCTVESLNNIRKNDAAMEHQIEAAIIFAEKVGEHPIAEFQRRHRFRRQPTRFEENAETQVNMTIVRFYKKEFNEVLDVQIQQFGDNLEQRLQGIKPLSILQPPFKEPSLQEINDLVEMFPASLTIDPFSLQAEFGNFVNHQRIYGTELKSAGDAANFSEERKSIFPLTNKCYRLLMTAPVTVAKDERTFSRLKLVKTYLRTTMTDARLNSLMIMSCEKDLTDQINIEDVASCWAKLKERRIKYSKEGI